MASVRRQCAQYRQPETRRPARRWHCGYRWTCYVHVYRGTYINSKHACVVYTPLSTVKCTFFQRPTYLFSTDDDANQALPHRHRALPPTESQTLVHSTYYGLWLRRRRPMPRVTMPFPIEHNIITYFPCQSAHGNFRQLDERGPLPAEASVT